MASEIESETIDAGFPVAGIDNDTQGFRDNFSVIKQSLASAGSEITVLQSGTAKRDENNNFAGNDLIDCNLFASTQEYLLKGTTAGATIDISFIGGHYQKLIVDQDVEINFNEWPTRTEANHAKMRVEFEGLGGTGPYTLTFISGDATILKDENFPATFSVDDGSSNKYIIDVWKNETAGEVYLKYVGTFS
jgi:hypothetical protein|tara:strand:- start:3411 stop:3983 length:573 start_codon:yes stop_codon:yes gene_type:complete